eukprot:comp5434_c0_seq1/m.1402 comp5434_c0_seq1/g.1402  ORF comp5434_c0_seq1/g.1402 comp5434_c0_seq1/m.1402 type:complete len:470 (-) comp5434_c0_seq1:122-1531(-)
MDQRFLEAKKAQRDEVDKHFEYKEWKIGEGTYGVVYKAKRKDRDDDVREYALKKIKGTEADGLSLSSCREISVLRELRHENVVCMEEVYLNPDPKCRDVWLLFEYAEYDLYQILQHHRTKTTNVKAPVLLPERMVCSLMYQILLGMQYLHDAFILHRDLKPANILVMGEGPERGKVKIGDLGMARLFNSPLKALSEVDPVVVTIWYRAPELLLGTKHYTKAVDQWGLGCIFAELMTTKPIFRGAQQEDKNQKPPFQKDQLEKIFNVMGVPTEKVWPGVSNLPDFPRLKEFKIHNPTGLEACIKQTYYVPQNQYPDTAYQLLHQMLVLDPSRRLSCKQALESDFFRNPQSIPKDAFQSANMTYPIRTFDEKKPKVESRAGSAQPPPAPYAQQQPRSNQMQGGLGVHQGQGQHHRGHQAQHQPPHGRSGKQPQNMQQQQQRTNTQHRQGGGAQQRYGKNLPMPGHQQNQHY